MLDTFNLPDNSSNLKKQIFYNNTNTGTTVWQVWVKPNNAKFVHFVVIGAGGGGGGGASSTTGTSRRGGGGGGSSSITTGLFSANQIPDTLYVQVGAGGTSGIGLTTNSNGGSGEISYVSVAPDSGYTTINILLQSGTAAATGGASGTNSGTAGVAGTAWTGGILSDLGLISYYDGQNGGLGQTTQTPINIGISGITTGGAPGAGTNGGTWQPGGNITGSGFINTVSGGTVSGGNGSGGYMTSIPSIDSSARQHMLFTGGAGGASSDASSGGVGGNGTFGSGGAGGGAGFTNLGGNAGKGGDGLVIITAW
jgi:hypothetical protein